MTSSYREDCIKAKNAKREIIDQKEAVYRSKKLRPIVIEYRMLPSHPCFEWSENNWVSRGKYETNKIANVALENFRKKHADYEFRIKQDSHQSAA